MTPHPSTCQCGGSGKIAVHPIYPLKMINECPGMETLKSAENRCPCPEVLCAGSLVRCDKCQKTVCSNEICLQRRHSCHTTSQEIVEWEERWSELLENAISLYNRGGIGWDEAFKPFIRQLLSSHSQALQERHEAGLLKLVNDLREDYRCPDKDCAPCYSRESVLSAVESYATHLNPKS